MGLLLGVRQGNRLKSRLSDAFLFIRRIDPVKIWAYACYSWINHRPGSDFNYKEFLMKGLKFMKASKFIFFLNLFLSIALIRGNDIKSQEMTHIQGNSLEDTKDIHRMLVFGEKKIYLSHLPMFDGVTKDKMEYTTPHRYQVILEASFQRGEKNLQNIYFDDRRKNPSVRIYTLDPELFVLPRLSSGSPLLTEFKATIFRGHVEKKGLISFHQLFSCRSGKTISTNRFYATLPEDRLRPATLTAVVNSMKRLVLTEYFIGFKRILAHRR